MNKKNYIILFLLYLLSGCYFKQTNKYPFSEISKNNYEEQKFNYKKIKSISYEFCNNIYFIVPDIKYDLSNLINIALTKFKEENSLKENQYFINIKNIQGKYFILPLIYSKNCRIIQMDLVEVN